MRHVYTNNHSNCNGDCNGHVYRYSDGDANTDANANGHIDTHGYATGYFDTKTAPNARAAPNARSEPSNGLNELEKELTRCSRRLSRHNPEPAFAPRLRDYGGQAPPHP